MGDQRRTRKGKAGLAAVPSDAGATQGDTTEQARAKVYGEKLLTYVASGTPLAQAARILEVPETSAKRYFAAALDGVEGLSDEQKRDIVRLDLEALRLLIQAHMPHALRGKVGNANVVLSAVRERAQRLGLNEALTIQISNTAVGDAVEDVVAIIEAAAPVELPALPMLPPLPGETEAG